MEDVQTITLEERTQRATAETMLCSQDPKERMMGQMFLDLKDVKSGLWKKEELRGFVVASVKRDVCPQCGKAARDWKDRLADWVTNPQTYMFFLLVCILLWLAARDGVHLGGELRQVPGASRLETTTK